MIVNKAGLHARAAAKLVHEASNYQSEVQLLSEGEAIDAKSILGILLIAAAQGSSITIRTEGVDEQDAMSALLALIADGFGEDRGDDNPGQKP